MHIKFLSFLFKFLIICNFTILSINAFSQGSDDTLKKQKYQELSIEIENLEFKAQYSGDDETIRSRLKLPPKLPPYDQWASKYIIATEPTKEEVKIEVSPPKETEVSTSPPQSITPTITVQEVPATAVSIQYNFRYVIFGALPTILLILNFILYRFKPKFRSFLIAPPFGLGEGKNEEKSESELSTRSKRLLIEFGLLFVTIIIYFSPFILTDIITKPDQFDLFTTCSFLYLTGYLFFVIGKLFAGYTTKCPKCSSTFARSLLSKYDEPKSTYRKKINSTNANRYEYREVGLTHFEWSCTVCSHQWHTAKKYDKITSEQY
jgi:hypothetical protein